MRRSILLYTLIALIPVANTPAQETTCVYSPSTVSPARGTADLLIEGFEDDFPPAGWTRMTSGAAAPWVQSDQQAFDGSFSAYMQRSEAGQVQDEWLVTSAIDTTGIDALYLEFQETGALWANYGIQHEILVSTTVPDNPEAFTSILQMLPGNYTAEWLNHPGRWGEVTVDLSAYAGMSTVHVAIRYRGWAGDEWWVDNLRLFEPPGHDIESVEVQPQEKIWSTGVDVMPQLLVMNTGTHTETFDVRMDIERNGSIIYTQTASVIGLAPIEERTIDFPDFTTELGIYEMTGTALLDGDENPDNDTAYGVSGCYSGQRTPFGMLVTNWGCGPCVQANEALNEYYATQGNDVALIRVHAWWPADSDPMYLANPEQCAYLIENTPTGVDYAPHLWLDNFVDGGSAGSGFENAFEDQKLLGAPLTMDISFDDGCSEATVSIDVFEGMPDRDWVLHVAVTEDGIDDQGPNGEPIHYQVFRRVYPDLNGTPISTAIGSQQYTVPLALDGDWEFNNLRATAWVQDPAPQGLIMNAATIFLDSNHGEPLLVTGPGPAQNNPPLVRVFPATTNPEYRYEFPAYGPSKYGVNVSCGDVTGNGLDTIITGAGPGAIYGPHVRGFMPDGSALTPDLNFLAYGTNKWGVNVAAGDIDGDGRDEIITGAGPGAVFGPHVRGWDYDGTTGVTATPGVSYFAYGTPKWGVNVSAGDIDGDGYDEIVTGAGPGSVYGPHVRGWNVDGGAAASIGGLSFLAYGTNQFGVNVSCGDVDGDGIDEIITGPGPGVVFGAHVRGWNYDGESLAPMTGISFFAWPPETALYGAKVFAGADFNGDGRDDLVAGCGPDIAVGTPVKVFTFNGATVSEWISFEAYSDMALTQGTTVAGGKF